MRHLIFLVFLVLVLPIYGEELPSWKSKLNELRSENERIKISLIAIDQELQMTKNALANMKIEFALMQSVYNEQKKALEERIQSLEEERTQLIAEKEELKRRETQLFESDSSVTNLKMKLNEYIKIAENTIATWKGIAIFAWVATTVVIIWKLAVP